MASSLLKIHFVREFLVVAAVLMLAGTRPVRGHGRLMEPPARNCMWRVGFDTPPNFEDSELFCGGIKVQWKDNEGRCGPCGDRYDLPPPRPHETGGNFSRNISTRVYAPGTVIDIVIDIVANHQGWFQFSLCPRDSLDERETEECFDKHILPMADRSGDTKYPVPRNDTGIYTMAVRLPDFLTCEHCVLRWHWFSGNNWGTCDDGREAVGCGPQETYRNCADISIKHGGGIRRPVDGHSTNVLSYLRLPPPALRHPTLD